MPRIFGAARIFLDCAAGNCPNYGITSRFALLLLTRVSSQVEGVEGY